MIETKSLLDLLRKLFQTVKLFRMYGRDHPQIQENLKSLEGTLALQLAGEEEMRIVYHGDTLLVQDAAQPPKDQAVSFLAESLKARSISSITLHPGVPLEEVVQLVKVLAGKPDEVAEGGNFKETVQQGFKKVSFNKIRYVAVNESQAVVAAGTAPAAGPGASGSALTRSIEGLATALERAGYSGDEPQGQSGPSRTAPAEKPQPRTSLPRTTPELLDFVSERVVPGMTSAWEQLEGILGQLPQNVRDMSGTATKSAMRAAIVSRQVQSGQDLELARKTFRDLAPDRNDAMVVFDALAQALHRAGKVLPGESLRKLMEFLPELEELEEVNRGEALVVDGNLERCSAFKAALAELGFTVQTASTAREAIEKIARQKDLDAIVLQLDLPDKRGTVVLSHIHGSRRVVPAVVIPTAGEVVAADASDFEFFSYPRKKTIPSQDPKVVAQALGDFAKKSTQEQEERKEDLDQAREVQRKLVPAGMPQAEGWELDFHREPAAELGGDFADVFRLDASNMGIVLGEVSRRGIAAALAMVMVRSTFRLTVSSEALASDQVAMVNQLITPEMRRGMFVNLVYARVHVPSGHVSVVNCGQSPPVLYDPCDGSLKFPTARGLPLGLASVEKFEDTLSEEQLKVPPGGQLLFYSEGAIETLDEQGERFTDARLHEEVKRAGPGSAHDLLKALQAGLAAHRGSAPRSRSSDTTLIAVRRRPRG